MTARPAPRTDDVIEQSASGMAAEHTLLGLLALNDQGIGHGYDLARHVGPDSPLGNVIRIEPGMVYHHLKKLERLGWVESREDTENRPARRLVALTGAGRTELSRWLGEPVTHTREIRLEFLVKLYFALVLDPELAVRLVAEQREVCVLLIASLNERRQDRSMETREQRFGELVVDMRLAQTEAALAWLDRVGAEASAALAEHHRATLET